MLLGLELKTWLALTAVGAIISTIGSLLGVFLKDYFFTRSFERWKQEQALEQIYQRYKDPLFLSACELASRLMEINEHYPTVYLRSPVLATKPERQVHNSIHDPYFQRHKLLSSIYRLAAMLGWLELYRQEVTYLKSGKNRHSKALEYSVEFIRSSLADGQLNQAVDWADWRDTLIFREELRAIGESMLDARGTTKTVVGYGRFCEALEAADNSHLKRWFPVVANFLLDLEANQKDFRQIRLKLLLIHVVDLMRLLDAPAVEDRFIEKRNYLYTEVHITKRAVKVRLNV